LSALAAYVMIAVLLFIPALADIGSYSRTRADAQNAADSAALAALQEIVTGGDPDSAAAAYAADNGAGIVSIKVSDKSVIVTVEKDCGLQMAGRFGIAVRPVRASGKAELKDYDDKEY
jgi:Flp pilus assembly protein TadG